MRNKVLAVAQQWRASVDAINEEMCLLDLQGKILRCNRAVTRRLGRPYSEIVGSFCRESVCSDGLCGTECPFQRLQQTGLRETRDVRLGDRWCHVTADPVTDDSGALLGAVLIIADVTDQRRAEEALQASEPRHKRSESLHRMLMDSIPSSVLLLDKALRVVLVNRNFLEKSRRTLSGTVGRPLTEVFPEVILANMGLEQQIRQAFTDNRAKQGQRLTFRAPGVPIRVYYYSIIPVSWQDRVDHVLLLMEDVTEQMRMGEEIRRMERHLASVIESASDMVLSTDTAGRILTWNRAAETISGYCCEEVRTHPLFEYFEEAGRDGMRVFFSGAAGLGGSTMAECDLITKKGTRCPISWVFSPMPDGLGRSVGFVAVGRDLTERRKFERQLLQSHKLATLGVMAGGIAHEIRTPLAISSSAAQFLMEEDITAEFRRECAAKVHVGIQRASAIIENLLRFAHPSERVDRTSVDLRAVLKEALSLIANQARVQKIQVVTRFPEKPLHVLGVASLLEQMFLNLFLNAINAMPNGGMLDLSAEPTGAELLVRVADTGHGISREDIANIFDPFYTRAPAGKGTGLGLSICYSIIKQHLGSIDVESEEGKGSVFTVKLRLR